jgi:hypothetical protein
MNRFTGNPNALSTMTAFVERRCAGIPVGLTGMPTDGFTARILKRRLSRIGRGCVKRRDSYVLAGFDSEFRAAGSARRL